MKNEENARLRISPYARKTAERLGVNPKTLQGTGPCGRIVFRDVQAAADKKLSEGVAGFYIRADVRELLRGLSTLEGQMTWEDFVVRAAKRHLPNAAVRFVAGDLEAALPHLAQGEEAVLTAGEPRDGEMWMTLIFNPAFLSEETAESCLCSMKETMEEPLSILI